MKPNCECIAEIEQRLVPYNTRFQRALTFGDSEIGSSLMISTEVAEKKRGARPVVVFPTFCPFCGVEYQPDPAKPEAT